MNYPLFTAFVTLIMGCLPLAAKDKIPAGYTPIAEFEEAIEESRGDKLIVLVIPKEFLVNW